MGLGSFIGDVGGSVGIGDLIGGFTGETGREAASDAAGIFNQELIRQFEQTQENLLPALEAAQRQLPGIQQQLTPQGFGETLFGGGPDPRTGLPGGKLGQFLGGTTGPSLSSELAQLLAPTQAAAGDLAAQQLSSAGLSPTAGQISSASEIDPATMANLLLGAEADLFGNRLALSGLGQGAGTALSELGQRTGAGIAQANIDAQIAGQQATASGQQNALALAGLASKFFTGGV